MTLPFTMRSNCNLDLRFPPSGMDSDLPPTKTTMDFGNNDSMMTNSNRSTENPQHQEFTIFYNGKVCVSDVTEFQARSIIWLARREMGDRMDTQGSKLISPLQNPAGLSMKRSLQQFLQKRKNRIEAVSPYNKQRKNREGVLPFPFNSRARGEN